MLKHIFLNHYIFFVFINCIAGELGLVDPYIVAYIEHSAMGTFILEHGSEIMAITI